MPTSPEKDLFAPPTAPMPKPLVLELRGIAVPPNQSRKDQQRKTDRLLPPNCHVPSMKNSKMLITKGPRGNLLPRPFLITKPEMTAWMEQAVERIVSTLCSMCQTGSDATPQVRSKLWQTLSFLPADDSVNDLTHGSWKIERCEPGNEGATITITRLT